MPKSIVFAGTPEFAVPSLDALINDDNYSVEMVITQPDKPAGRGNVVQQSPVKQFAVHHGIDVSQPENIADAASMFLDDFDYLVVVAYGQILPPQVLELPTIAPVNLHPSLLPKYRGPTPLQQVLLEGEIETGVTIQRMVSDVDAGPILAQKSAAIDPQETYLSLHDRMAKMGALLLQETLKYSLVETPQDERKATFSTKLSKEDGIVNVSEKEAEEIERMVRALNPWPGVRVTINGTPIKIHEASLLPDEGSIPLTCKNNTILHLISVQESSKKIVKANDWSKDIKKAK